MEIVCYFIGKMLSFSGGWAYKFCLRIQSQHEPEAERKAIDP